MPDILNQKERKARKPHYCSYCGEIIKKGETYDWCKLVQEGTMYEWKSHKDCSMVASELWEFIDPDEGMTEYDFEEGCRAFCDTFICPGCRNYQEDGECISDNYYCLDKIVKVLKKYELKRVKDEHGWTHSFELFERCEKEEHA